MPLLIDAEGQYFIIHAGSAVTIGRDPDNEIILDDPSVSRHHATITGASGRYYVRNLSSMNGTFLSGHQIADAELSDGDQLRIGRLELTFRTEETTFEPVHSLFCTKCGASLSSGSAICGRCGAARFVAPRRNESPRPPAPHSEFNGPLTHYLRNRKMLAAMFLAPPAFLGYCIARHQTFKEVQRTCIGIGWALTGFGYCALLLVLLSNVIARMSSHSSNAAHVAANGEAGSPALTNSMIANIASQANAVEVLGAAAPTFAGDWASYTVGEVYSPSGAMIDSLESRPESFTFQLRNGTIYIDFVISGDPQLHVDGKPQASAVSPREIVSRLEFEDPNRHYVEIAHYELRGDRISYTGQATAYDTDSTEVIEVIKKTGVFIKLDQDAIEKWKRTQDDWEARHQDVDIGHFEAPAEK
jgi:hypothetical protein